MFKCYFTFLLCCSLTVSIPAYSNDFTSFSQAKRYLKKQVTAQTKTLYCGCDITKQGKRLVPETEACGYEPRNQFTKKGKVNVRALRIEWEHIVPAWEFGHQLQCWQQGGRKNCRKNSEKFRTMEADINNLAPAIGEINADRSNFRFGVLPQTAAKHGACDVKIDFKQRVIQPPKNAKKQIADTYFYMQKTYGLKISNKQQKLFNVWAGGVKPNNLL